MGRNNFAKVGWGIHGIGGHACHRGESHEEGFMPSCHEEEKDQLKYGAAEMNTLLDHVKSVEYLTRNLVKKGIRLDELTGIAESLSNSLQNLLQQASGMVDNGNYAKAQGDYAKTQGDRAKAIADKWEGVPVHSGGDAISVGGLKIKVLYPAQYNPEEAEPDTIYLIIKAENVIAIPDTVEYQFEAGDDGFMPESGDGWIFKTEPTVCKNAGIYTFPIALLANNTVWADGTREDKVYTVRVKPKIIDIETIVTKQETGSVIPASELYNMPGGVTYQANIVSGQEELREAGTYVVELSISDPNYIFANGSTITVTVTITEHAKETWKFGNKFPIIFSSTPTPSLQETWKFGNKFPIVFN